MKSTHDKYATKEDAKKFVSVGKPAKQAVSYTKSDFLPPSKVAEKFGISIEEAKKIMKQLRFRNASFILNGHMAKVIVNFSNQTVDHLHPRAIEIFEQQLKKQKA